MGVSKESWLRNMKMAEYFGALYFLPQVLLISPLNKCLSLMSRILFVSERLELNGDDQYEHYSC
jgi:hypothetical protein